MNNKRIITIEGDEETINRFDEMIADFIANVAKDCTVNIDKPLPLEEINYN